MEANEAGGLHVACETGDWDLSRRGEEQFGQWRCSVQSMSVESHKIISIFTLCMLFCFRIQCTLICQGCVTKKKGTKKKTPIDATRQRLCRDWVPVPPML
jgi:hypothetical protein